MCCCQMYTFTEVESMLMQFDVQGSDMVAQSVDSALINGGIKLNCFQFHCICGTVVCDSHGDQK